MIRPRLAGMPIRTGVMTQLTAVVVTAAGILTAGCASAGSSPSAVQLRAPVTVRAVASPARLTMAQARTAYSKISAPFNAAVAVVNADARHGTTWRKFKTDVLAAVAANKTWERRIRAKRWPRKIQPYVNAMLKTEVPAEISCDQAMAAAGSLLGAAHVFSSDRACRDSTKNADTIRKMLKLPPTIG
jgi:hypothetical protein